MEHFNMKIIMRRVSMIFYSENHRYDNAVRRCLLNRMKLFYCEIVLHCEGSYWKDVLSNQYESFLPVLDKNIHFPGESTAWRRCRFHDFRNRTSWKPVSYGAAAWNGTAPSAMWVLLPEPRILIPAPYPSDYSQASGSFGIEFTSGQEGSLL